MEDARFFYYSNLAKYSLTNNFVIIILIIIEMFPIIIHFMEAPFILRNYYNNIDYCYSFNKIKHKPLSHLKKINIYALFRNLRNDNKLYPFYILIIMLSLVIFYIIFFIVFSILDRKNRKNGNISSTKSFGIYFKIILVNLYDHIVFRTCSLYVYEVIINYLIVCKNYFIVIIMIIMFSITLYLNIQYFNTFRLSIKYDLNYKYVYDGKYMLYADYFSLSLKLFICFSHNSLSDNIVCFFIILNFIIISCSVFKFITSNCFNVINCSKGMIFIFLLLIVIFNFIFPVTNKKNDLYYIYLILTFLSAMIITIYLRYYKILKVIRAPITTENNSLTQEKFELLCEYYQYSNFNYLLNQICFASNIKSLDEKIPLIQSIHTIKSIKNIKNGIKVMNDNNALLHKFLTFLSNKFKEDSDNMNLDKDINLFYYIICKIYLELMTNQQNNFFLLFETRKILLRLKKFNLVLYYDLKFFYELLCQNYSFQNNTNFLIYNEAFLKIFETIKIVLFEYEHFITKRNYLKVNNYINISNLISIFSSKIKKNYDILSSSSYKDEYQKIILRVIFEGLFNEGITKDPTSILLINEEFSIYEEMLDKQYHSDKYLRIKIELKNLGSKIIKIGKDLNFLLEQNIESMFPSQFIQIAKKRFYYDYETQEKNIGGQIFKFFINDNNKNIKEFVYFYKIYPKLKNDITYLDGYYQLGNHSLLITEKDFSSNQENIIITSQSLQDLLYIDQNFIDILEKFQCYININSFIHISQTYIFHLNAYTKYLINLSDKLINMCSNEELKILNPIINEIKKIENINFHNIIYQFNNVMSIIDENLTFQKEYKIYSIKQIKKNNFVKEETIDKNKNGNDDEFQSNNNYNNIVFSEQNILSSVINAMDINSVSSVSSRIEGLTGLTGISNKRKNHSNENKSCNNMIIIIFNLLVIILSIIALIYENNLNNELLNKISFYKVVHTFNMLILNTMFGYYSFLCYVKYDGEKCVHEMKYYLNDIEFSDIYTFNQYEHQLKINFLIDRYKTLRSKVANKII